MLIICSYTDIRSRGISLRVLGSFLVPALALMIGTVFTGDLIPKGWLLYEPGPGNVAMALMPGLFLLLVSFLTGEAIGRGDVYVVMILGLMVGFDRIYPILFISMAACGLTGLVLIALKKRKRDEALPYMPFLLAAYLAFIMIGRRGGMAG